MAGSPLKKVQIGEVGSKQLLPAAGQMRTFANVPEGMIALVLSQLAVMAPSQTVLHICRDDVHLDLIKSGLSVFAPEIECLELPAWDCLPYDRVSPTAEVVSERLSCLQHLKQPLDATRYKARLVLATPSALMQRVPAPQFLDGLAIHLRKGGRLDVGKTELALVQQGYIRVDTVREPGQFARRGGIFDLFAAGAAAPWRIDLFGDEIETIRTFDAMTQRTTGDVAAAQLLPAAEFLLDDDSINLFRQKYRESFGAVLDDDPLYQAVSEGRRHGGMEHWLPLFHDGLSTLFAYVPQALVSFDDQVEQAVEARWGQISDFYQARTEMQTVDKKSGAQQYKPVPPLSLYLDKDEWARYCRSYPCVVLSPFPPVDDAVDVNCHGKRGRNFVDLRAGAAEGLLDAVVDHVATLKRAGKQVYLVGYSEGSRTRLLHILEEHGADSQSFDTLVLPLNHGFETDKLALITETDIFGERLVRPPRKRSRADKFLTEVSALNTNDLVVHADHGLGRYVGLETLIVSGAPHDCLCLVYEDGDKLYVPVENINVLTRYGDADSAGVLDKLGGTSWQGRKAKVKKKLLEMAAALLKIAAERSLKKSDVITPPEGLYDEFCARFPYTETEDQQQSIQDVLDDLAAGKPMDRLVCGDVGFGKTEVALRAAMAVAASGLQVAVVTPTTLLCRQHYKNFSTRFQGFPLRVAQLSRLVPAKEQTLTKRELADGKVDIIIGTHALLAKTISFHRLGLVIVDEEQHFGVKQKERLKELRTAVHVLTLTATPIPRTLQMALAGVRELSLMTTPPVDRLAVRSYVLPYDPVVIKDALMREHFRGGQSFYVCPRIEDLAKLAERLAELVPDLKVVTAHGQMGAEALETVMTDFYAGKYDILLATNIIESGLDIPNANTIIMHRADLFGLAQLYQLRGRVGRGKLRGYAYLTYQQGMVLSDSSRKRLEVMATLDSLGAGFQLASHDMDIRGGGNLLGDEQSGHIREVGVELYQHMLEEAVAEVKSGGADLGDAMAGDWQPQINLGLPVLIPDEYVPELTVRLGLYRRLAELVETADLDSFAAELVDRFGKLPVEVENLLSVMAIKQTCRKAAIERFDAGPKGAVITFRNNTHPNPIKLVDYLSRQGAAMKLRPDHKLVVLRAWDNEELRLKGVKRVLKDLAELVSP